MNTLAGDNGADEAGRRSRFSVLGGMRERATSQPPRDGGIYFAEHSLSPPGLRPSERWANSRLHSRGQGLPPTRSASFSTSDTHSTTLGSSVRSASHFPSTFEDAENQAEYDDPDSLYEHRSRGYDPSSRSRSQSLAVFSRSSSSTLPAPGAGMAQSWRDGTLSSSTLSSSPLAEHRYPASRMPTNMYASSPAVIPYKKQQQQPDISNMSPFVRDVGQIMYDDVRDVWGPQRDDERGGGGSGTTSRRHSVSVVQPRRAPGSGPFHDDDIGFSSTFGSGRLMISDEDLATDLNMLNLNFHESNGRHLPGSQPASLPIYGLPNPGHGPHHYHTRDVSRSPERTSGRSAYRPMGIGSHPRNASFTSSHLSDIDRNSSRSPHRNESPFRAEDSYFGNNGYRTSSGDDGYRTVSSSYKDPFGPLASPSAAQALRHSLHHLNASSGSEPRLSSSPTFPPSRHSLYGNSPLASPISARPINTSANQLPSAHQQLPIYQGRREQPPTSTPAGLSDLGRGVPLHSVPESCPLFIVEFKAARTDIFYCVDPSLNIKIGDLVIVEADRGKDLGKVINDTITLADVEAYQKQKPVYVDPTGSPTSGSMNKKEISPKRIYAKAQPQETQSLLSKMQDEQKALQLCQTKVKQKKLPMEVVDAEYQWDRRKLTFYFIADKRIDFRELVRELFRLYKTRIWMACLQGPAAAD